MLSTSEQGNKYASRLLKIESYLEQPSFESHKETEYWENNKNDKLQSEYIEESFENESSDGEGENWALFPET